MALPEFTKVQIDIILKDFANTRIPPHVRNEVQFVHTVGGNAVTLFESRPAWDNPTEWIKIPVAKFRYNLTKKAWTLYYCDRNSKWHLYRETKSNQTFAKLLAEVDSDPTGIFWG